VYLHKPLPSTAHVITQVRYRNKMADKKKLIIIAHAPSENTNRMLQAVIKGANHPDITNVEVRYIAPLDTQADDILSAQAVIIGTTENLGYMAGLIKDVNSLYIFNI
jgi:flavorubredoxin